MKKIIGEYEINPWMAKNIRELSLRAQEDSDIADELIIYTPKFKIEKNKVENDDSISTFDVSIQSGYYYKGYLGYDYMDDIWHASSSPTFRNIRVGSGVKRYISETIYNSIELASDTTLDYISYGGWSLAKIFIGSPVLVHEGTTGDVHQASLDESKWRKYTSIDMGNGDGYNVRAVSDRSSHRFENMLVINGVRDFAYSSWQSAECDNYNNLDQMAYRYRDMPWTERIVGYDFNDLTYFRSIN